MSRKKEDSSLKRYMHPSDHNSTIYNNQDMEVTLHVLHTWGAF